MTYPTFQEYNGRTYKYNLVLTGRGLDGKANNLVCYTDINDYGRSIHFEDVNGELVPWSVGAELAKNGVAGKGV